MPAGIDRFDAAKINLFFGGPRAIPGVPVDRLLALGAEDYSGGQPGIFNMAVMGLRLAQRANGVSQLHGVVSREMFDGLWPGFDDVEVPISSITNGVHAPTWVDRSVYEVARKHLGTADIAGADLWHRIDEVPADAVWATKREMREKLVTDARRRVKSSWHKRGASEAELGWVDDVLSPDVLTIGFARRVPTYKRLTLMLRDPARLKRLLLHPERPVQLIIAGKSHPADETGKRLIQEMVRFADDPEVRHRIVFLPNYDIAMAQHLYPGCDVWLNNPLRPFEACGTSGMKAALNGGLNLSILDGWWDEWFDGRNGWAIPTADGVEDADRRDDIEATALYDLIENEVAAKFYDRDDAGLPQGWIAMMTHTLKTLGPKVLASRMVEDYTVQLYGPAAGAGRALNGPRVRRRQGPRGLQGQGPRRVAERQGRARRAVGRLRLAADRRHPRGQGLRRPRWPRARRGRGAARARPRQRHRRDLGHARSRRCSSSSPPTAVATSSPARSRCAAPGRSATACASCPGTARSRPRPSSGWRATPEPSGPHDVARQTRIDAGAIDTAVPASTGSPAGAGTSSSLSQSSSYAVAPGAVGRVTSTSCDDAVEREQHRALTEPGAVVERLHDLGRRRAPAVAHGLAVGAEPREVGRAVLVHLASGEERALAQHRVLLPQAHEVPGRLEQVVPATARAPTTSS